MTQNAPKSAEFAVERPMAGRHCAWSLAAAVLALVAACGGEDNADWVPPPPTWPDDGRVAQVTPGGTLHGHVACARAALEHRSFPDGTRRLTNVLEIWPPKVIDNRVSITLGTQGGFQTDYNGFGGESYDPQDRRDAAQPGYQYFVRGSSEFEVGRAGLSEAAFGRTSDNDLLCFFAAGSDRRPLPTGSINLFYGFADGIAWVDGMAVRLAGRTYTHGLIDYDSRQIDLTLDLTGLALPLTPAGQSVRLGIATARLDYTPAGEVSGVLSGPGGSSGAIVGSLFEYGFGIGLVFELSYPNGDRMYGAIAIDVPQI